MPCIWGKYSSSRIILQVAIIPDSLYQQMMQGAGTGQLSVFNALVDTGATSTCITNNVVTKCELSPIGQVPIQGVSGQQHHNNYLFRVAFAFGTPKTGQTFEGHVHIFNKPIQGPELKMANAGFDILLGMDVLGEGSLKVDGDGSFSFSF